MSDAVVLNSGAAAWAFEAAAERLAAALGVPVSGEPASRNYVLAWDGETAPPGRSFIPWEAIRTAADKRRLAEVFEHAGVPTPVTLLLETEAELHRLLEQGAETEWALKWPTGCGGGGHRMVEVGMRIPEGWPRPFVVQEFVRLERPEVYRLYGAGGDTFGWNVRRFPPGVAASPWVAHARGAVYEDPGPAPDQAVEVGRGALAAVGVLESFGCADLVLCPRRGWLVLEVNSDGVASVVDREIGIPGVVEGLERRLSDAFHRWQIRVDAEG